MFRSLGVLKIDGRKESRFFQLLTTGFDSSAIDRLAKTPCTQFQNSLFRDRTALNLQGVQRESARTQTIGMSPAESRESSSSVFRVSFFDMKPVAIPALLLLLFAAASAENWPQWRGPSANSISAEKDLPVHWTDAENIAWKLPLPAWSGSTPHHLGRSHFYECCRGRQPVPLVHRSQGPKVEWKKLLGDGDHKERKQNMSSPSPVTDGKNVWVLTGTGVLKGFDYSGNEIWGRELQKDYGKFGLNWGYASSPVLYEDSVYVQVLQGMKTRDPSYILRVDKKDREDAVAH